MQPHPISTEDAEYIATINISQTEKKETDVNYKDFRDATGEIVCKGYTSEGGFLEYPECGPIDKFVIHVLIMVLLIGGIIISAIIIWRKIK